MKLYIAGPMSGLPEMNYPAFYSAEEMLWNCSFETLNPARNENDDPDDYREWIRLGLYQVLEADGVCLLDGWSASKGAVMEVMVAHILAIPVRTLSEWCLKAVKYQREHDEQSSAR